MKLRGGILLVGGLALCIMLGILLLRRGAVKEISRQDFHGQSATWSWPISTCPRGWQVELENVYISKLV
jgi:hypothetical protein